MAKIPFATSKTRISVTSIAMWVPSGMLIKGYVGARKRPVIMQLRHHPVAPGVLRPVHRLVGGPHDRLDAWIRTTGRCQPDADGDAQPFRGIYRFAAPGGRTFAARAWLSAHREARLRHRFPQQFH